MRHAKQIVEAPVSVTYPAVGWHATSATTHPPMQWSLEQVYDGFGGFGGTESGNDGGYDMSARGGTEFAPNYATRFGGLPFQPPFVRAVPPWASMTGTKSNGGAVARIETNASGDCDRKTT